MRMRRRKWGQAMEAEDHRRPSRAGGHHDRLAVVILEVVSLQGLMMNVYILAYR